MPPIHVLGHSYGKRHKSAGVREKVTQMQNDRHSIAKGIPGVYINDDEVEFKIIYIYSMKSGKGRKYTISEAERRGLVRVESGAHTLGNETYSKSVSILDQNVKLCLTTRGPGTT